MNRLTIMVAAFACSALAACATPADRITSALEEKGVPRAQATCMGERLQRDLSVTQLRELARLVRAYRQNDPDPDRLSVEDLIRVASQVRDPQVPIIVGRTAVACRMLI